ncbi:MAG: asparaginase [Actinomycetota bacterium]
MTDVLLAVAERSGLTEQYFNGSVAVTGPAGEITAALGDIDRAFFIRSAAKPFQAWVAHEAGLDVPPTHLALVCASHSGDPVHVAIVRDILRRHGLDESALACPRSRPFLAADRRLAASGDLEPSAVYHNCSGKHAGILAACRAAGLDTQSYLEPSHPLQQRVGELIAEVTGDEVGPPGVDGCGMPVWRVTAGGLARAYHRLAVDERFASVRSAMSRYPTLVSGEGRGDGSIGRWTGGVAKGGAAGCMGAAVAGRGMAVKSWSGNGEVAALGVVLALEWLGILTRSLADGMAGVFRPPVYGGGKEVGRIRPAAVLETM